MSLFDEKVDPPPGPPPGSDEAKEAGCLCPRVDNSYGKGWYGMGESHGLYVMREDCPIHGVEALKEEGK